MSFEESEKLFSWCIRFTMTEDVLLADSQICTQAIVRRLCKGCGRNYVDG